MAKRIALHSNEQRLSSAGVGIATANDHRNYRILRGY